MKLGAAQASNGGEERVIHDFSEIVSTGYISLIHAQASIYFDRCNGVCRRKENILAVSVCELERISIYCILRTRTAIRSVVVGPLTAGLLMC